MSDFLPLVLTVLSLGAAHAQPKYTFAILDTGRNTQIRDLNDSGVAVGSYQIETSSPFRAFVFEDGAFLELGDFGGGQSSADEINNHGVIVGTAQNTIKEKRPFYRERDTLFEIMPFPSEFGLSINDKGQIVGYTVGYGLAGSSGYLFDRGMLKLLPKQFWPAAINDDGVIVGMGDGTGGVYRGDSLYPLPLPSGFTSVNAVDINNRGQVAGFASRGDSAAAFIFEKDAYHWLPTLGGRYTRAVAINDLGQVVGTSAIGDKAAPFLYENGKMHALQDLAGPSLGSWLLDVSCINNKGQIAAYAQKGPMYSDWVAVILTPSPSPTRLAPVAAPRARAASRSGYRVDGRLDGREGGRPSAVLRLRRNRP
jgi:probable HAF family extracellular repeat protein